MTKVVDRMFMQFTVKTWLYYDDWVKKGTLAPLTGRLRE